MTKIASLKRRFAAMSYESLLLMAVAFFPAILAGLLNIFIDRTLPSLSVLKPILTTLLLLYSWWYYFKISWKKEGQTLPMRVWHLALRTPNNEQPHIKRLRMRFTWAVVFLLFIPLMVYYVARFSWALPVKTASILALLWWILPWGFALFHPRRQFLYDYLAGTELLDVRQEKTERIQS